MKTTEEVGSELADMREGLMNLGLHVFDDCEGYSPENYDDKTLLEHKEKVLAKIEQLLNLGVPVIVNMRDPITDFGHYEVVIRVESNKNIILAEPGGALVGQVQFESIPQDMLINRWKNMSGKRHGRFLVISPNEAASENYSSVVRVVQNLTKVNSFAPNDNLHPVFYHQIHDRHKECRQIIQVTLSQLQLK